MRNFTLAAIAVLLFSGCTTFGVFSVTAINYERFSKEGFFITESNAVSFEYEPISSVASTVTSGYVQSDLVEYREEETDSRLPKNDNVYGTGNSGLSKRKFVYVKATPDLVTDMIVEEAKKMGANGIINFSYTPIYTKDTAPGWMASGMAIKR